MKYPIGIQDFATIIEDGYVYVDKTDLIYKLTHEGKVYFLSRPRRFGKSLLVSTLEYYYRGKKDLFKGLKIDSMETEWMEYPVFHIDFSRGDFNQPGVLEGKIEMFLSEWEKTYGKDSESTNIDDRFWQVIRRAHEQTGRRAVVLIDEYDKPILDVLDTGSYTRVNDGEKVSLEERNRNILKALYSTFKSADRHLQFVLLTGVTKFSQVSVFSGFNQPKDLSMDNRYEALCGIAAQEMRQYFSEPISTMACAEGCTEEEMWEELRKQYDGYHFGTAMTDIYNPYSLLNALDSQEIADYWFRTGTPSYLVRLLSHTRERMNELTGRWYDASEFIDYKADMERPLPMIYQSGYLTIKDYDRLTRAFLLDFPNDEVCKGFLTMIANDYLKPKPSKDVNSWLKTAARDLQRGNLEQFMRSLMAFLADIPYTMRRKKNERERERYFHYTFYLLLRLLSTFTVYTEKEQSKGRVDCIVETSGYVYVFEFKLDGTAEEALRQINEKGYARPYAADPRKLYRIGVNFSSEEGTVEGYLIAE